MELLPKIKKRAAKRLGRGYGSGKGGHTSSRGSKGQKARSKVGLLFEGFKVKKSLLRRLPLQRGKGKNRAQSEPLVVNLEVLNIYPANSKVNAETLVKQGIVKKDDIDRFGVKILGNGDIKKKLTIEVAISKSAAKKVEKAGGKVENLKKGK